MPLGSGSLGRPGQFNTFAIFFVIFAMFLFLFLIPFRNFLGFCLSMTRLGIPLGTPWLAPFRMAAVFHWFVLFCVMVWMMYCVDDACDFRMMLDVSVCMRVIIFFDFLSFLLFRNALSMGSSLPLMLEMAASKRKGSLCWLSKIFCSFSMAGSCVDWPSEKAAWTRRACEGAFASARYLGSISSAKSSWSSCSAQRMPAIWSCVCLLFMALRTTGLSSCPRPSRVHSAQMRLMGFL